MRVRDAFPAREPRTTAGFRTKAVPVSVSRMSQCISPSLDLLAKEGCIHPLATPSLTPYDRLTARETTARQWQQSPRRPNRWLSKPPPFNPPGSPHRIPKGRLRRPPPPTPRRPPRLPGQDSPRRRRRRRMSRPTPGLEPGRPRLRRRPRPVRPRRTQRTRTKT